MSKVTYMEHLLHRYRDAVERIDKAKDSLVETGYFTADEVSDDIAPRIWELYSKFMELKT